MIPTPDYVNKFSSAKTRFLKGALESFFQREFPKLFGPILREKLVEELLKILDTTLPPRSYVKPGQMIWNAVDISTRADAETPKFVPVILTLVEEEDVEQLAQGVPMIQIRRKAIARILNEAYAQGGLLSMRDIGLLSWRHGSAISQDRLHYEKEHHTTLPHPGSLQDMGTCISHKGIIIRKVMLEKKDPCTVARETKHSLQAVERYLKDYYRVQRCFNDRKDIAFTVAATGLSKALVTQHWRILQEIEKNT